MTKKRKPLHFVKGGLHRSTHTPKGQKISATKHREARAGFFGTRAKRQELFYENVLRKRGRKR